MSKRPLLELFASDEQLAELEVRHAAEPEVASMALAWALRQRDPSYALSLAHEAAEADLGLQPRLWLIESEHMAAQGQPDAARALCEHGRASFEAAGDRLGVVDALLVDWLVASEQDVQIDLVALGRRVLAQAEVAGDALRLSFCQMALARQYMNSVGLQAQAQCEALLPPAGTALHPSVAAHLAVYRGLALVRGGDQSGAVQQFLEARQLALNSGQVRMALVATNNVVVVSDQAGEFAQALEWGQMLLSLARSARPAMLSHALAINARVFARLGQLQEASELLEECLSREQARPNSRARMIAALRLGEIEQLQRRPERGLLHFESILRQPGVWDLMRSDVLRGRTGCLLSLGRLDEAEASVRESVQMSAATVLSESVLHDRALQADVWLAQGKVEQAYEAYARVLADSAALPDCTPSMEMLRAAASAHAAAARYAEAYELSRRAGELMEQSHGHLVEQRSRALYSQFRTERNRLEAEHLRRLSESSAERLAALERNKSVLESLGFIGRELTAHLDTAEVLAVLARHVRTLLPVDCLIVYLLDGASQKLECALCEEGGRALPAPTLMLNDKQSLTARCARSREVIVLQDAASRSLGVQVEGMAQMVSRMFAPLLSGKHLVGVMSVQSAQADAFGAEAQLIFATLCAYAAIALDNARAYRELGQMQRQLRAQERMAALGSMVAGLSHELNTPLGNALLAVSTLKERSAHFEQRLAEGALRRSDWVMHAESLAQGTGLILGNLETALGLVNQFRQVAQRRDTQQRRRFGLAELCMQSLALRSSQAQQTGHAIEIAVPDDLELDSYAHAIDQALDVLVGNALLHGLTGGKPGHVRVQAERINGERCRLAVLDDGRGMSPAVLERAFEPFFTTTFGKGGNGLGLSICHTLVEDVLGGKIEAFSEEGRGSRFVMELPLSAP